MYSSVCSSNILSIDPTIDPAILSMKIIALTGFMGCGKSSVGRRLSELLCCPYMDLDAVIEERTGRSIPEIFASDGEAAFRQMELEALQSVVMNNSSSAITGNPPAVILSKAKDLPTILSLGGGTVMTPECASLVHEKTLCIYLRTSVDTLVSRLCSEAAGRPMLNPGRTPHGTLRTRIESLMSLRASTYERTAHLTLDTDGHTIDSLAQVLANEIDANR